MKLRYFYKIDSQGNPILGSNIRRQRRPNGNNWKELKNICCDPDPVACSCKYNYFVQVDALGNPIDYSLIKRYGLPNLGKEGMMKFARVERDHCCGEITWEVDLTEGAGQISVNEVLKVNESTETTLSKTGALKPVNGATIDILVDANCADPTFAIEITGGITYSSTSVDNYSFVYDSTKTYNIKITTGCEEASPE